MNPRHSFRALLLAAAASIAPTASHAATYYWDGSANVTLGQSDNTTTTGLNWLSGGLWDNGTTSAALASWAAGDAAVFGGSASSETITLGSGITVGNLTFGAGAAGTGTSGTAYTITGSTLTLSSSTITTNTATTISSALAGSTGFTKAGAGTLTFSGSSTMTGNVTINAGTLKVTTGTLYAAAAYNASAVITVNSGGTLELDSFSYGAAGSLGAISNYSNQKILNGGTINIVGSTQSGSADFRVTNGGTGAFNMATAGQTITINDNANDNILVGGTLTFGGAGNITINEVIANNTGAGTIVYGGSGTLTLTGANTFTGNLTGNSGTVTVTGTLRSVGGITANNGGTINLNTTNLLVAGHGVAVGNGVVLTAAGTGAIVFGNIETRIGNVTLNNGGTLTSNRGTGSYDVLLANTSTGAATVTVSGTYASSALMNGTGGIHLQGVQNFAVADINGTTAADLTVSMVLADPGTTGGSAGGVNKTGAGTMKITTAGTYTGATTVAAGVLELATANYAKGLATSSITVSSGAFLDVNGINILYSGSSYIPITLNGGTVRIITGSGAHNHFGALTLNGGTIWGKATSPYNNEYSTLDADITVTGAGAVIKGDNASYGYSINNTSALTQFSVATGADLTVSSPVWGGGGILKTGDGKITLSGSNSYTLGTTVRAGTMVLANSSALGSSGTITLNDASTGTSNVTLNIDATAGGVTINRAITVANQGTGTTTLGSATTSGNNAAAFAGAITINKDVTLNGGTTGDLFKLTGGIGGTGNLTIAGTSRVVLAGTANTYAGTTLVNSGAILQLSDGAVTSNSFLSDSHTVTVNGTLNLAKGANSETIGALAGSGTVQGHPSVTSVASALVIGGSDSATFSGVLANGGASGSTLALTKSGTGTQTLSGTNTYTGATAVSNGVLNITGSLAAGSAVSVASGATLAGSGTVAGSVTLASGGILAPGASNVGTLTLGSLTLGAAAGDTATINFGVSGLPGSATVASLLQVNGNLALNGGAGKVTLGLGTSLANLSSGTYHLVNYTGTQLADVTGFAVTGTTGARQAVQLVNGTKAVDLVISAAYPIWTGLSSDWSAATGAWKLNTTGGDTNFLANDTVHFDGTAAGGTVNLTADVAPISVAFEGDSVNYTLGTTGGFAITSGLLTKSGNSTLTINNANTFSGGTTIVGGSVILGDAGALGSGAITLSGGTLDLNGKTVTNTVVLGGGVIAGNGGSIGAISETGGVRGLTVGSSLTLTGANSFTGAITINAGTLEVAGSGTLGGGAYAANIANAGILKFSTSANQTLSGVVSGAGSLTKAGNGTLTLTGVNTFSGATTITGGTLEVGGSGQIGSGSYSQNIANDGILKFSTSANQTLSGVVSGTGSLTKAGTGTLTLTGANTFSGATSITAGTLDVSGSGQLGGGSYSQAISNAGILKFSSSANQTLSGTISGAGSLTKTGSGTLTLSNAGNNTFSGGTTLTQGVLSFANGNLGSSGNITMNGGTLQWASGNTQDLSSRLALVAGTAAVIDTNGNDVTFASAFGGSTSATLNKTGSGKLTLNTLPTFTGAATVSGGTLKLGFGYSSNLAIPSITVASGATLELASQDVLYWTAGKGALTINGGTVTINSGLRATIANTINMTGGTLAATGSGDTYANYSLLGSGVTATSDASGNAAVISAARLALQDSGGQTTFNVTRGAATPASDLNVTGAIVNMNGSNNGLSKTGTGIMTVSGTNTYSGGTTILGGTLVVNSAAGLSTGTLNVNGGTLSLGAAVTGVGAATLTTGTISGAGSLSASSFAVQSGTVNAVLAGSGALTKSTASTVTLNAANTYTGGTTINAGRITVGVTNAIASGTAITLAGGELVGAGGGTYTLTPSSITFSSGTANRINNGTAGDTSLVIAGTGGLSSAGSALYMSGTHTYSGTTTISGSGYLEVSGAALSIANSVLNLTSNNATRAVDIWAGKLTVRGLTGTGIVAANGSNGTVYSGPALAIVTPDAESYTFSGALINRTWNASGVMAVTKSGAGTQVLSGSNTYSGGTTITAGTLAAGSSSAFGTGTVTLSGGTLDAGSQSIANAISLTSGSVTGSSGTLSGVISGTGALTKTGNGTLTLSGNNSFSGGLTVSAGTLVAGSANALGTGAVSVNGGTLQAGGLSSFATGAITVNGGTLDLGGYALGTAITYLSGSITGAGSYTGALALNGGTLTFADLTTFGSAAITVGAGATLDLAGFNPTNAITLAGGTLLRYGNWNQPVALTGNVDAALINSFSGNEVSVKPGATVDLTGVTKDIVFQGGTLNNLGSYQGTLVVQGTLNLATLPSSNATIRVGDGGAVDFGGATFGGAVEYSGGSIANYSGDVSVVGTGVTLTAGSLGGANVVVADGATVTIGSGFSNAITLSGGAIAGDTLNNYSGTLTLASGTLDLDGSDNSIAISTAANIVVGDGATLKGNATVGSVTLQPGGILAPGNSPGLLNFSSLALAVDPVDGTAGSFTVEIASLLGAGGGDAVAGTDFDAIAVSGLLDLSNLTPTSRFTLNLLSLSEDGVTPGAPKGWDPSVGFQLAIFSYGNLDPGLYSGNLSVLFQINSLGFIDGFGQHVASNHFSIVEDIGTQQLRLVYNPVPEPSTYGAILGGLALAAAAIRRRRKMSK